MLSFMVLHACLSSRHAQLTQNVKRSVKCRRTRAELILSIPWTREQPGSHGTGRHKCLQHITRHYLLSGIISSFIAAVVATFAKWCSLKSIRLQLTFNQQHRTSDYISLRCIRSCVSYSQIYGFVFNAMGMHFVPCLGTQLSVVFRPCNVCCRYVPWLAEYSCGQGVILSLKTSTSTT